MAAASSASPPERLKGSFGQLIVALVLVTLLAGGAGAFLTAGSAPNASSPVAGAAAAAQTSQKAQPTAKPSLTVQQIPVVITNLKSPSDVWLRLETSMVFDSSLDPGANPEVVAGQLATDFLAYARTLTLADFQTPDGLQDLRADLDDRAATRSHGAVREILIRTLVFQ